MISILVNILFYGFLGMVPLGIGIGVYSKYGILGVIRFCLVVFALPSWIYAIYRMLDNLIYAVSNHFQGALEGLFDIPFIISLIVIGMTLFIGVALCFIELRKV